MDRSLGSIGGIAPELVKGKRGRRNQVEEHIPPVLSAERAAAVRVLKPFLKAIADINRIAILQELSREGDAGLSVLDVSDRLMLSQPLTSWHLHILKRARLVTVVRLGRQRIYRLDLERLGEHRKLFDWVMDF